MRPPGKHGANRRKSDRDGYFRVPAASSIVLAIDLSG
jgi:hypothetical protein